MNSCNKTSEGLIGSHYTADWALLVYFFNYSNVECNRLHVKNPDPLLAVKSVGKLLVLPCPPVGILYLITVNISLPLEFD